MPNVPGIFTRTRRPKLATNVLRAFWSRGDQE
jgi:hypothetical protein